jgi:hypothetical protein
VAPGDEQVCVWGEGRAGGGQVYACSGSEIQVCPARPASWVPLSGPITAHVSALTASAFPADGCCMSCSHCAELPSPCAPGAPQRVQRRLSDRVSKMLASIEKELDQVSTRGSLMEDGTCGQHT